MNQHQAHFLFNSIGGAGFGSEVNNLAYAIYYFEQHHLDYTLMLDNWVSSYRYGWSDYFVSLQSEQRQKNGKDNIILAAAWLDNNLQGLAGTVYRRQYLSDLLDTISQRQITIRANRNFRLARRFAYGRRALDREKFICSMHVICNRLFQPRENILRLAEAYRPAGPFHVLHIRRGDKVTTKEDRAYEVEEYAEAVRQHAGAVRQLFVMSDDSRVFQEVAIALPEFTLHHAEGLTPYGYDHQRFIELSPADTRGHTEELIAQIEVARRAKVFFGTVGSNLFRLIEYLRGGGCIDVSMTPYAHTDI